MRHHIGQYLLTIRIQIKSILKYLTKHLLKFLVKKNFFFAKYKYYLIIIYTPFYIFKNL